MNDEDTGPAFGTLLRSFRTAAALSQESLAKYARMSPAAISALERGTRRSPYRGTVSLLADALSLAAVDRARFELAARQQRRPVAAAKQHASAEHNLPAPIAGLIGRESVIADVRALLDANRLVTLVGTGGVGKTRVALQIAQAVFDELSRDVLLIELAPIQDAAMVATATARACGIQGSPRSVLESIVGALRHKHALLVMDNCEHVIAEAGNVVVAILRGCPNVRILATSREALTAPGEQLYRIPSLEYPLAQFTTSDIAQYPSVRLFVDRAKAVDHRFRLRDDNAQAIAEVCRRLDGIPLAIELAAARAVMIPPHRLAEMLDGRFRVLSGGDRTAPARLQTMRAAIAWSVDLLSEAERIVMRRLAIFVGGWTLEAAEVVCADELVGSDQIFELLTSLAAKSLASVYVSQTATRYGFLESIRAYALEQLAVAGEEHAIARRHATWAADYGEWLTRADFYADEAWWSNEWPGSPEGYEPPNRTEALRWAMGPQGDALLAARIAGSIDWEPGQTEGRRLTEMALSRVERSGRPDLEARLWLTLSGFTRGRQCLAAARSAVRGFDGFGERSHWLCHSLAALQEAALEADLPAEALSASDRLLALLQDLAATRTVFHGVVLRVRGHVLRRLGRFDECRACIEAAMSLSDSLTQRTLAIVALAELESDMGNARRAVEIVDEGASAVPRGEWSRLLSGDRAGMARNRGNAAAYRLVLGDMDGARRAALDGIELARRGNSTATLLQRILSIQYLAAVAASTGEPERGARLKGYVDAWFSSEGELRYLTAERAYRILVESLETRLSRADIDRFATEGALFGDDEALEEALATGSAMTARA